MLASTAGFHLAERFDEVGFSDIVQIRNRVMELRAQGASVYQFEGGEPFRPTPDYIKAAATAALDFLSSAEGEERRQLLWRKIDVFARLLSEVSAKAVAPASAIFPWIVGDEQAAVDLFHALMSEGFLVPAIRYPTVAKGSARLRIALSASHEDAQIEALCSSLRRLSPR